MQRIREKLLIFRASEGRDSKAFGELYGLYIEPIYRFVYFKTGSKEDAEDLVSQAFLKTWEYLIDSDKPRVQNFRAFIYQVARNLVARFYENKGRSHELLILDEEGEEPVIEDHRQSLFLDQLYKSDRAYLADCLKKIKDGYREVIVLRYLEDMSVEEIAKITEKTSGNVRVLMHRGIQALKKVIQEDDKKSYAIRSQQGIKESQT